MGKLHGLDIEEAHKMQQFDIPVVLVFFNRPEFFRQVLEQVKKVKPQKLYLISDYAREDRVGEKEKVKQCRQLAEEMIDWECEVIKNYANENKGCCDRIGGGAAWVFSQEEKAVFLEDDNVPDLSFFAYCKELLERYEHDERIFWICGGNYLVNYNTPDQSSYIFSKHMYPCGWASWRRSFQYFDEKMTLWNDIETRQRVLNQFSNKKRREDMEFSWGHEAELAKNNLRQSTWDFQWSFIQHVHKALTIVPKYNLIHNIGVSPESTHGVTTMTKYTKRLLFLDIIPLEFPLKHPAEISVDTLYDTEVDRLLVRPGRLKFKTSQFLKKLFGFNIYFSFTEQLKNKFKNQ